MKRPRKPELRPVSDDPLEEALRLVGEGNVQAALRQLAELELRFPDDPEVILTTTVAALRVNRVCRAALAFERFARRWPGHRKAAQVAKAYEGLDEALTHTLRAYQIDDLEIAAMHEESAALLVAGEFEESLRLAEAVLEKVPTCNAARTNRAHVLWLLGNAQEAASELETVLGSDPQHPQALALLTRFRFLEGRVADARTLADRLIEAPHRTDDAFTQKMESLSYMGADAAVVTLYEKALQEGSGENPENALLHHLGAVAAARLGREAQARGAWNAAVRIAPQFQLAKANLDDSRARPGDRNGPWAFALSSWVSASDLRALQSCLQNAQQDGGIAAAIQAFLQPRPGAPILVRSLLERGDPVGRDFGLMLASNAGTPEMDALLREYATGPHGPDRLRLQAVRTAVARDVLGRGPLRIWLHGVHRATIPAALDMEKDGRTRPQVKEALDAARAAIDDNRLEDAEALLAALENLPRLTRDEVASLCEARVRMLAAQDRKDEARDWLDVWGEVRSGAPAVAEWRRKLES